MTSQSLSLLIPTCFYCVLATWLLLRCLVMLDAVVERNHYPSLK